MMPMKPTLFLLAALLSFVAPLAEANEPTSPNVHFRGSLANSRLRFERDKLGHVAFMGGSITEMNGYRPIVMENLAKRFPDTKFTFTNAGISSTCSTTGAHRLATDVLAKGPVDLFFVEFAVNDDQDAQHARRECIRGLEGIVRQLRAQNPGADIVITYFVNERMLAEIDAGKLPLTIESHEAVAEHYDISSVNLAKELSDRIKAGTFTWKQYGGVHPAKPGNTLCAGLIEELFAKAWKGPRPGMAVDHVPPAKPLDEGHYGKGRFIDLDAAKADSNWTLAKPDWKAIPGSWRDRYRELPMLQAAKPGAELTLPFDGQAIGAFLLAGPDAGMLEVSIDGGETRTIDLFHNYSKGLHYPRSVLVATDLKPGPHVLKLRVSDKHNEMSKGTAVRLIHFEGN